MTYWYNPFDTAAEEIGLLLTVPTSDYTDGSVTPRLDSVRHLLRERFIPIDPPPLLGQAGAQRWTLLTSELLLTLSEHITGGAEEQSDD